MKLKFKKTIKLSKPIVVYDIEVDNECHNFSLKNGVIVHNCYHPHGDSSIYSAMVNMVNECMAMVIGKGNFGYSGLIHSGAAAARYTKVGLSEYSVNNLVPLFKYTEKFINENDYEEPVYVPTVIPHCLFTGAMGIGLGCATKIPGFNKESLFNIVEDILLDKKTIRQAIPLNVDEKEDREQITRINTTGIGEFRICSKVEWINNKDYGRVIQITNVPSEVNLEGLKKVFAKELEEKLVFIQDQSKSEIKIIIGRNKRVRRISDEELEAKARKASSKKVKYVCYIADVDDVARVLSPIEMIRKAIGLALKAYNCKLLEVKEKISDDILFQEIKEKLALCLLSVKSKEEIKSELKINERQYGIFTSKSISTLRSEKKDVEKLSIELDEVNKNIQNINKSFLKTIWKN